MHIKKDMSRFYDKLKKDQEARRNPEKPYFFVAPNILRKKVASYQQQQRESRKPSKATLTDYDRTLTKSIEAVQKKEAGRERSCPTRTTIAPISPLASCW